jgi:hypothetical protein
MADPYKRILLKLSGEALQGDLPYGIDPAMLNTIAAQLKAVQEMGTEVAIRRWRQYLPWCSCLRRRHGPCNW